MRKVLKKIGANPFHSSIGVGLIGLGMFLIMHDRYFKWPPMAVSFANDNFVGFTFIVVGVCMLYWVFDDNRSARFDHAVLSIAAALMMLLTSDQLANAIKLGIDMPWIPNAVLTVIVMILAYRSDSQ